MLQLFVLKKVAQYHLETLLRFRPLVRCVKIAQQDKLCVVGALLTFSETSPDMHCVAYLGTLLALIQIQGAAHDLRAERIDGQLTRPRGAGKLQTSKENIKSTRKIIP